LVSFSLLLSIKNPIGDEKKRFCRTEPGRAGAWGADPVLKL